MSFGFSRFGVVFLCLASSCLVAESAHAQGQARPRRSIELTETNSAEVLTNLDLLTTKKDVSRQIDEQLRSLKGLSAPGSMDGRFSLPYVAPTVVPNKKLKDLLQQKRNWGLTSDQVSSGSFDLETIAGYSDDKNGGKNALQQFYDTLMQPTGANPNGQKSANAPLGKKQNQDSFENSNLEDDSNLPVGVRATTKDLKEAIQQDPGTIFNPTRGITSFDNFFGQKATAAADPVAAEPVKAPGESFLDQYKRGLDPATVLGLSPSLSVGVPASASSRAVISADLSKLPTPAHKDEPQQNAASVSSVPDPTTLSDLNATVLNAWNPLYAPPKIELPKYSPPTPPNLEFPRRRF